MQYELWFEAVDDRWGGAYYYHAFSLKNVSASVGYHVKLRHGYSEEGDMGFADVFALYPYKSKANRVRRYIAYQRLLNPQFPFYVSEEVPDGCSKEAVLEIKRGLDEWDAE